MDDKIEALLPSVIQENSYYYDFNIFYNITMNEYNIFPLKGENECIFIGYDFLSHTLDIVDSYVIKIN